MGRYFSNILSAINNYEKKFYKNNYLSRFKFNFKKEKFKNIADIYNIDKALTFFALKQELAFVLTPQK